MSVGNSLRLQVKAFQHFIPYAKILFFSNLKFIFFLLVLIQTPFKTFVSKYNASLYKKNSERIYYELTTEINLLSNLLMLENPQQPTGIIEKKRIIRRKSNQNEEHFQPVKWKHARRTRDNSIKTNFEQVLSQKF